MKDKNYTLNEFAYNFQKMGVSIVFPDINGIVDYHYANIDHGFMQIDNYNTIKMFSIYFQLPNFATLPEIYLRRTTANLDIIFKGNDFSQA